MNLAKSELKLLIAKNLGSEMVEQVERAKGEIHQFKGALTAYAKAEDEINKVSQLVGSLARDGKLEVEGGDAMEVAKFAVAQLMKASKAIHDLAEGAANNALRAEGVVKGIETAAKLVKNMQDEEANKLEALAHGLETGAVKEDGDKLIAFDGPGSPRVPGQHPGLPMKAQRQAEEEAVKRVDKGNGSNGSAKPAGKAKPKKAASKKKVAVKKRSKKKADARDA
jgi:hypothetical protein